jgi:hypothetical protein
MNATLTTRHGAVLLALIATLAAGCAQDSSPVTRAGVPVAITIPGEQIFPESITSTRDGSVIIGSLGTHQIFRAAPGASTAASWIPPGTDGLQSVLGVFADEASGTLYACSDNQAPGALPDGALYAFDLTSGAPLGHHPFPTAGALCNDIAVGPDGTAYATDTNNMEIVRLRKGASDLEVWVGHGAFGPKDGALDGIALVGNRVVVTLISSGRMFSVPIQPDGSAGSAVPVTLSRKLRRPDGIRSIGQDSVLVAETGFNGFIPDLLTRLRGGPGAVAQVKLAGDEGSVTTLRRGFPDGAVSVTQVGTTAYVLEGQLATFYRPAGTPAPPARPFRATAVELGTVAEAGKL